MSEAGLIDTTVPEIVKKEHIAHAIGSIKELFDTKLDVLTTRITAMDQAQELLRANVNQVPSTADRLTSQLKEVMEEKFTSVETQFKERDVRTEQDKTSTKVAVDAALSAQKEAAGAQNDSNTKAIEKSEAATAKQIDGIQALLKSNFDALNDKITDLKGRIDRGEGVSSNQRDAVSISHGSNSNTIAIVAAVIAALAVVGSILMNIPHGVVH